MVSNQYIDAYGKSHFLDGNSKFSFRPGVYVFVKNDLGEILFVVDSKYDGCEVPGGGMDPGESFLECGIRELKEESGYDIDLISDEPFFIYHDLHYSSSNEFKHRICFYFEGILKSNVQGEQDFTNGETISDVKFFKKEDIKDLNFVFWHRKAIEKYLEL